MQVGMKLESDYLNNAAYRKLFSRGGSPFEQLRRLSLEFVEFPIRSDFRESLYRNFSAGCFHSGLGVTLHPYPDGIINPAGFEDKPGNPALEFASRCLRFADEVAERHGSQTVMTYHPASSARTHGLPWAKEDRRYYFERSREYFQWMTAFIRENDLSVLPVVELQLAPRPDQKFLRIGDTYGELLEVIEGIDGLALCWDMGHGMMNHIRYGLPKDPPEGFVSRVKHVHLHDITRGRDHHPLLYGSTPYRKYLRRLRNAGFNGKINLELTSGGINHAGDFARVLGICVQKVRKAWCEA